MIPRKRVDIKFCPFCGKDSKIGYDGFLLKCYECGRKFSLKEHRTFTKKHPKKT